MRTTLDLPEQLIGAFPACVVLLVLAFQCSLLDLRPQGIIRFYHDRWMTWMAVSRSGLYPRRPVK